jgi:hypothetical protein
MIHIIHKGHSLGEENIGITAEKPVSDRSKRGVTKKS